MGSLGVGHDWATSLSLFTFMHWRRRWQPTPVFLPGESQGRGSLVGCRLWGCRESSAIREWDLLGAEETLYAFGEGNGTSLQYSCLENSMDKGAWQAIYSPWGHKESDMTEQLSLICISFHGSWGVRKVRRMLSPLIWWTVFCKRHELLYSPFQWLPFPSLSCDWQVKLGLQPFSQTKWTMGETLQLFSRQRRKLTSFYLRQSRLDILYHRSYETWDMDFKKGVQLT